MVVTTVSEPGRPRGGGAWEWEKDGEDSPEQGLPTLPLLYCEGQQRLWSRPLENSRQPGRGAPGTSQTKVLFAGCNARGVQVHPCVSVQNQTADSCLHPVRLRRPTLLSHPGLDWRKT